MNLKKVKIFTRIAQLEKKVEELDDLVAYLLHENDSNIALIEVHEKWVKSVETKLEQINFAIEYLDREKVSHEKLITQQQDEIESLQKKVYLDYLKIKSNNFDDLSKFKYDETEC